MAGQHHQSSSEDMRASLSAGEPFNSYGGTSGHSSSAGSPALTNAFVGGYVVPQYPWFFNETSDFLPQGPGSIPIRVEFEAPYDDQDRRKRRNRDDKPVSSHVHSADFLKRRRAQNRASQRAFRDRKEKHMKELGQRLEDLEVKHQHLIQSYEDLQAKYDSAREKLEMLSPDNENYGDSPCDSAQRAPRDMKDEDLSALFFDNSATFLFQEDCYNEDQLGGQSIT